MVQSMWLRLLLLNLLHVPLVYKIRHLLPQVSLLILSHCSMIILYKIQAHINVSGQVLWLSDVIVVILDTIPSMSHD